MSDYTVKADELAFTEFPPASREQWLTLVSSVLKGAPFEKRLVSKTYDGIAIAPLYGRDGGARAVFGRKAGAPWQIVQRIEFPDPADANAQALHDIENGATGLALVFAGAIGAYGFGIGDETSLARLLEGIFLDAGVALDLQPGPYPGRVARQLTEVIRQRGVAPAATVIRFGFDPLGIIASGVQDARSWRDRAAKCAATIGDLAAQGYTGPFVAADGRVVHNAGGSEAQELAYVIATALAYLRALETSGIALDDARRMIYFRLAADADQFLTTAKFRALRRLWARVEEACGLIRVPIFIAAETAWRMMTRRDPAVNMLRATMAVVAAGLGGADSIAVVPHTAAIGLPDGFARRIARNTQLILLEESNLAKVADPAAGSGTLESLTHELCVAAWSLFQEIEKAGGAAAALEQGLIQAKVAAVRAAREKAIARRKDALTGTSEFPDIAEAPVEVLAPSPPRSAPSPQSKSAVADFDHSVDGPKPAYTRFRLGEGRGGGSGGSATHVPHSTTPTPDPSPAEPGYSRGSATQNSDRSRQQPTSVGGGEKTLPCRRLAEPFEVLRDASDRALEKTGVRPKIFLANLGSLADFTARATYARNFFEAGGIAAVTNDGFRSREDMLAAFKASSAGLVCLCASDAGYAVDAVEAATALRAAGATHIYLAGRPGELEAALKAAGVGTFIYVGCDVVATLTAAHAIVGAA
jgi:methylmalonyl-CoA mutase